MVKKNIKADLKKLDKEINKIEFVDTLENMETVINYEDTYRLAPSSEKTDD
ncbi:MAG: hypothetical protein HRU03_01075 [Nanoarchaeales archaeon]|nr:hypothetical protein [Nanoarchaeales archaeon]